MTHPHRQSFRSQGAHRSKGARLLQGELVVRGESVFYFPRTLTKTVTCLCNLKETVNS